MLLVVAVAAIYGRCGDVTMYPVDNRLFVFPFEIDRDFWPVLHVIAMDRDHLADGSHLTCASSIIRSVSI